ncbi:MAG: hypothetical protein EBV43_01245 [Actinobacteria bacterium]|nr:hypothetical protein [Actinomycetota bacterium]
MKSVRLAGRLKSPPRWIATGCGDAWSAGFIAGLSRNLSLSEAAHLGSACGSLVASGLGSDAGIIDYESTQLFMATTPTLPLLD